MAEPWGAAPTAWCIDGHVVHVVQPPLVDLVGLLLSWTPLHLVLGTCRDRDTDVPWLMSRLMDRQDPFGTDQLHDIADALTLGWFGMPRWTVQEIWWKAVGGWPDVDGELTLRGVDVLGLPAVRATHTVRSLLYEWVRRDEQKLASLTTDLTQEPPRIMRREAVREVRTEVAAFDWHAAFELSQQLP